ncbi:MAG TPA: hypothetical protein K8V51_01885, partial [Campylobacter avium]|nr:hypothetical protein [Campylobacter avium]
LEITEKAKKYGVLSALLFDLKNTFKSIDEELNSFLEKLNIAYNTEKELFCLEVKERFEEQRIELQNSFDKDIRHSTVEQEVQESINTKRHRI